MKTDLEVIKQLQKNLETDPDAVNDILIEAKIIDSDGNLLPPYNGEIVNEDI